MPSVCFCFHVHRPYRLRRYTFFDIGRDHFYEDEGTECDEVLGVANGRTLPLNGLLEKLIGRYEGRFRVAFSLSGPALDQFGRWAPEVVASFRRLADTGCVEFLAGTSSHSLSFLFSRSEFEAQVREHDRIVLDLFGQRTRVFRNAEMVYNNDLARTVEAMGYDAVLTEGAGHVLGWRSPDFVYQPSGCLDLRLLLNDVDLARDCARMSVDSGRPSPAMAEELARRVHAVNGNGECLVLDLDYERIGEAGIGFLGDLVRRVLEHPDLVFATPSEVARKCSPVARLDVPLHISSAEGEHDLTEWLGNDMQNDAAESLYALEGRVLAAGDGNLLRVWRKLQASDHLRWMSTKWFARGEDAAGGNPYGSPYDAYINYMNILGDFESTVKTAESRPRVGVDSVSATTEDVPDGPKEKGE